MYRFVSSRNSIELKKAYLKKYNIKRLQGNLDSLMMEYPEIKEVLPNDISVKKLLVGNFKYLTKVYCAFIRYLNGKTTEERNTIKAAFVNGGFKYENHKNKIALFLLDAANGFEIHNCVYCDLVDVTSFTKANGKKARKFETDHVLDKGACPLVAMSLYNFVPSCGTCNGPDIKGTKTIGDTEAEMARLSPSAEGYDFDEKVFFVVNMLNPNADDLEMHKHAEDYEIDFDVRYNLYYKSINLFELKGRYNEQLVLKELLFWRGVRRKNPDSRIQEIADLKHVSFKEEFEEMFQLDKNRTIHKPMEKARRDVMFKDI